MSNTVHACLVLKYHWHRISKTASSTLSLGSYAVMFTLHHLTSTVVYPFSSLRNNSGIRPLGGQNPYSVNLATSAIRKTTGTLNLCILLNLVDYW